MVINNHIESEVLTPLWVGVVGYSAQAFDDDQARKYLLEAFNAIKAKEGVNVEIVSALTWLGVPGLAYEFLLQGLSLICVASCGSKSTPTR